MTWEGGREGRQTCARQPAVRPFPAIARKGMAGEALGLRLTPLARVINGLVGLQEKVPAARGKEQVDALSVHLFGQRALQPR